MWFEGKTSDYWLIIFLNIYYLLEYFSLLFIFVAEWPIIIHYFDFGYLLKHLIPGMLENIHTLQNLQKHRINK